MVLALQPWKSVEVIHSQTDSWISQNLSWHCGGTVYNSICLLVFGSSSSKRSSRCLFVLSPSLVSSACPASFACLTCVACCFMAFGDSWHRCDSKSLSSVKECEMRYIPILWCFRPVEVGRSKYHRLHFKNLMMPEPVPESDPLAAWRAQAPLQPAKPEEHKNSMKHICHTSKGILEHGRQVIVNGGLRARSQVTQLQRAGFLNVFLRLNHIGNREPADVHVVIQGLPQLFQWPHKRQKAKKTNDYSTPSLSYTKCSTRPARAPALMVELLLQTFPKCLGK